MTHIDITAESGDGICPADYVLEFWAHATPQQEIAFAKFYAARAKGAANKAFLAAQLAEAQAERLASGKAETVHFSTDFVDPYDMLMDIQCVLADKQ